MLAVSLLPLLTLFNQEGERPWHLWVPALAQITLMGRVLQGRRVRRAGDWLLPLAVARAAGRRCAWLYVARQLRGAALK